MRRRFIAVLAACAMLLGGVSATPVAASGESQVYDGVIEGARFRVQVPANWNGELFLWSRGHYPLGTPNVPVVSDYPLVEQALLAQGYAFAASAWRSTGWAIEDGLRDNKALLDWIDTNVGKPRRVYSWGSSMGGLTSIIQAERYPNRFAGVLSLCGPNAGAVAYWTQFLDMGFVVKTLIDPQLQLTDIVDPAGNSTRAAAAMRAVRATPLGRARLALSTAMADVPAWFGSTPPTTLDEQLLHLWAYIIAVYQPNTWGASRVELEQRAGGNPTWNIGVDYRSLFHRSTLKPIVEQAYAAAGASVDDDLAALAAAPRIRPDARAVSYLARHGQAYGTTPVPILTVQNSEDGLVGAEQSGWYGEQVARRGDPRQLRQLYIGRAHHCRWSQAELMAAVSALLTRVQDGTWGDTSPEAMNAVASTHGPEYHRMVDYFEEQVITVVPTYVTYQPTPLLRPFPN